MKSSNLLSHFPDDQNIQHILKFINESSKSLSLFLKGIVGSQYAVIVKKIITQTNTSNVFILNNLEEALYFLDDLNNLSINKREFLFPSDNHKSKKDHNIILERTEVLQKLNTNQVVNIITYSEAIKEAIIEKDKLKSTSLHFEIGNTINFEKLTDILEKIELKEVEFVFEPGEFAIRGFIIDIFSYSHEYPFRIVLDDNIIEEINYFNTSTQISIESLQEITIAANIDSDSHTKTSSLFNHLNKNTTIWTKDLNLLSDDSDISDQIEAFSCIHNNNIHQKSDLNIVTFQSSTQFIFNQKFDFLIDHLDSYTADGYDNIILVASKNQMLRLENILQKYSHLVKLVMCENAIKEGFIDKNNKKLFYTDHQLFERHHQYKSKRIYKTENALSIKELTKLKKGDYITHFDYGIGVFDGFRTNNSQESIRIIYKDNDVLYISIHALHKIAKYKDSDNEIQLDKLGSPRWKNLKEKVKNKIKIVAFDLIELYAKRKMTQGFSFTEDTYLQDELEASFLFQDTPDQIRISKEIKQDMESDYPMDRLVCGDVGFGKTELAIRAAFKAVADNKQVAILVPTTILALQHHKTFQKRLQKFPCNIKYLNRFISRKETIDILQQLEQGGIDIIIGTHRIISKDVKFKDLGLLIIDEEQKFGVSVKDKLKTIKESVDTLTLTATPIPRTLQFSLMGSRDLSIMTTYPKNRRPIETTISVFNHEFIKEIITFEISREGQVFFVHNRVANIQDVHLMIDTMFPKLQVRFAHGKMESKKLETTILDFINGEFDILITTTIIENGLDIPNANTIIINDAQNFGLSDLHQMRGRVGRSNKKAFCYLMTPPFNKMKDLAVKRLNAISNLSNLGDGFNISMKDLEIRGAGNMLGAEQSGFIADMGFANYQTILDEAITELKNKKFKKLKIEHISSKITFKCLIESDLKLSIPNHYVSDISERMELYNRLINMTNYDDVMDFKDELKDRFGDIPKTAVDLIHSVVFRQKCDTINCNKVILKKSKMILFFYANDQSNNFNKILNNIMNIIQLDHNRYSLKEDQGKLKFYINDIGNIKNALEIINKVINN